MSRTQILGRNAMKWVSAFLICLIGTVAAIGQENTGSIQGIVKDGDRSRLL
jgi:hypothetical protein